MKISIDLPKELIDKLKERSLLLGIEPQDLVIRYLRDELEASPERSTKKGHDRPFPAQISVGGRPVPSLTGPEIEEILVKEDIEKYNGSS